MANVQVENYEHFLSYLKANSLDYEEKTEPSNTLRIDVTRKKSHSIVKFYTNGTIQIQGPDCTLKEHLNKLKVAIENEEDLGDILPFDIENFPTRARERINNVDDTIITYLDESIKCLKAGSTIGVTFLLGAASERAILLLINKYADAIEDEIVKEKFKGRVNGRHISKVYDEFQRSFKGSKNTPQNLGWTNDLEIKLGNIFQFCRICRNEAGHPEIPPDLDRGIIIANMGQFIKYLEIIYKLIEYYSTTKVVL